MKSIFNYITKGTLLGASLLLGVSACTDDHFDISQSGKPLAANTIWQNVVANTQLDSLRQILSKARVMRSRTDRTSTNTYSSIFDGSQNMTLWAPIDGTYPAHKYLEMIDQARQLREAGEIESAVELDYKVASQFVQNHASRLSFESMATEQQVRLLNFKHVGYDATAGIFNNVPLLTNTEANVLGVDVHYPSSNGIMHLIDGESPFSYNIYDFLLSGDPRFSIINAELAANEQVEFDEVGSTPGTMNSEGRMEYADSIYTTTNSLLNLSNALLGVEDSVYIAMIPTDACYNQAIDQLKGLFKFSKTYKTSYSSTEHTFNQTYEVSNPDSLAEECARELLFENMYFSPSLFSNVDINDSTQVIRHALTADSLISTNRTIFYHPDFDPLNPGMAPHSPNPMFDGKTPEKASNGYIFALDNYKVDNARSFMTKEIVSTFYSNAVVNSTNSTTTGLGETHTLTDETRNPDVTGDVPENMYRRFPLPNTGTVGVYFRLPAVYSGKYQISVVCLPSHTNINFPSYDETTETETPEFLTFCAAVIQDTDLKNSGATINDRNIVYSEDFEVDQTCVKEYVLFDSFEFPKTYKGLISNVANETYPLLYIEFPNRLRSNCRGFNISQIILRPVSE